MKQKDNSKTKPLISRRTDTPTIGPIQFFRETYLELQKCIWPTRDQTIRLTYTVIIIAVIIGIILTLVDYGLTQSFSRFVNA
jgi:preprotein translocase SecE subunit